MTNKSETTEPVLTLSPEVAGALTIVAETVPARILGKGDDGIKVFATFDEMVNTMLNNMKTVQDSTLRAHWALGGQAYILVEDKTVYGENTIDELAKRLGLSAPLLYQCIAFYKAYSKEEIVNRLQNNSICYAKARILARCSNIKSREALEDLLKVNKIDVKKLQFLVNTFNTNTELEAEKGIIEGLLVEGEEDGEVIETTGEDVSNVAETSDEEKAKRRINGLMNEIEDTYTSFSTLLKRGKEALGDLAVIADPDNLEEVSSHIAATAEIIRSIITPLNDFVKEVGRNNCANAKVAAPAAGFIKH